MSNASQYRTEFAQQLGDLINKQGALLTASEVIGCLELMKLELAAAALASVTDSKVQVPAGALEERGSIDT